MLLLLFIYLFLVNNLDSLDITLDADTTYQTWVGWGTYAGCSTLPSGLCSTAWPSPGTTPAWFADVADDAVNDLGITVLNMSTWSVAQHATNYWDTYYQTCVEYGFDSSECSTSFTNDWQPYRGGIDSVSGVYHWDQIDYEINAGTIPLRNAIIASAQTPYTTIRIEDHGFGRNGNPSRYGFCGDYGSTTLIQANADQYGLYWRTFYDHMTATFGWVPDAVDLSNEMDAAGAGAACWKIGANQGRIAKIVGDALTTGGYTASLLLPSTSSISTVSSYFTGAWSVTDARPYIDFVSYHTYSGGCISDDCSDCTNHRTIGGYTTTYGIKSAVTEDMVASRTYAEINTDIKCANVSLWSGMYALLGVAGGSGNSWFAITNDESPTVTLTPQAKVVRQYSKYIRPGAVRIKATGAAAYDPVAFVNSYNNGPVVVLKITRTDPTGLTVGPLPSGTYGITYSLSGGLYGQSLTSQTLVTAGNLTIPSGAGSFTGALTIYLESEVAELVSGDEASTDTLVYFYPVNYSASEKATFEQDIDDWINDETGSLWKNPWFNTNKGRFTFYKVVSGGVWGQDEGAIVRKLDQIDGGEFTDRRTGRIIPVLINNRDEGRNTTDCTGSCWDEDPGDCTCYVIIDSSAAAFE